MTNKIISRLTALILGLTIIAYVKAADVPVNMTYQGHLMDANGDPLGKSQPVNKTVQFLVYDSEEGGETIWAEEQTVTVDNGYFSVILGEGTNLEGSNMFRDMEPGKANAESRYVGLKVDGVDITPRLRLLTTPYAHLSQHAVLAKNATRAASAQIADTLSNTGAARDGLGFVPVGGIIMWNKSNFPTGWAVCNGSNGTPDLRGRFVMGVGNSSGKTPDNDNWTNGNKTLGNKGGASHIVIKTKHLASHTHSVGDKSIGSHNHTGSTNSTGSHKHIQGAGKHNTGHTMPWGYAQKGPNDQYEVADSDENNEWLAYTSSSGNHSHTFTTNNGGSSKHKHTLSSTGSNNQLENRPPYFALYYIQRLQ